MLPAPLRPAGFPEDLRRDRNLCITPRAGGGRGGHSPRDRPAAGTGRALPSPPGSRSGPAPHRLLQTTWEIAKTVQNQLGGERGPAEQGSVRAQVGMRGWGIAAG